MKRIILTIDFDFFCQEDPMMDMGHRETNFFLNDMWAIREAAGRQMQECIPFPLAVPKFYDSLRKRFSNGGA